MCSRTYITIIVFIICEFVFPEKAFFGLGTGIRKKWLNSIFQQPMGDCRSFISCIPMTEDVKNAFLLEKEMQELGGIHNNVTVDGYQNFIFINRFGGVQHQGSLNKVLRRIIRDCNDKQLLKEKKNPVLLPNFSCHSLRHTFTTRLVEAGVNIKVIQNLCGHSRSDMTLDIYTTVTKELKQAEFDDFQKKLKEKKQEWKNRQEKDA